MQKSILVEIVSALSRKEMRDIQKWLQSPAHNQRQDVIRLFDYLVKNTGREEGLDNAEKEEAWSAVFPDQPYDDAYMRQVMYFLLKSIEEYLAFTEFTGDKVQYQLGLIRIYRKRKLEKAYKQAHRLGSDSLEKQPLRNGYYLLNKFFLEQEEHEHRMAITQNAPANLQEAADAFEKWFLEERLRISKDMLAHHRIYQKISYNHGLLEEALLYANRNKMLEEPAIAVYYYTYMALINPSEEEYFEKLEHYIHNHMECFDPSEVRTLYLAALNYCAAKVNQGHLDYCRKALKFYRQGLDTAILIENNQITRYLFSNAVAFAMKIGEFDWAESFIESYQQYLEEKHRNGTVNFSLSRLYFEKGDYDKAQRYLVEFEYDDMLQNIVAKTMLLKIYYEQDELDAFESLLESLRIYLRRKEALDPARKAAYKNLISLMKKLLHLNPYSKAQTERLRQLVETTNPLMERDWLLRQLEGRR
ncbi:MAG: hypothetical protein KDC61_06370 [Saprospiraceae bacterium]|nr:hypothetical protein [Saprospiraceae bacterium]MCB0574173.1 hypothetical protein [Saprospiraceae bacterium]MCB9355177.1 hypothetical protein [Lewinellaceae bacterium]